MTGLVLVVDDIPANLRLLKAKLGAEYYGVAEAGSGQEALDLLGTVDPDVILLDVMMPGMDGFEVCRRIKQDPQTSHIPVVMVTALSEMSDRLKGLEAGADDFLTKPVRDIALFSRVKSLARYKQTIDEWRVREKSIGRLLGTDLPTLHQAGLDGASVMIVENEPFARDRLAGIFDGIAGIRIAAFADGPQALAALDAGAPDLIVIGDLDKDGPLKLCSAIRRRAGTRDVPMIVLGREEASDELARAMDLGVNDYAIRPVDKYELLARAKTQVARHRYHVQLRRGYEETIALAVIDPLTGLYNRRYLDAHLATKGAAMRHGSTLGILFIDVDRFKAINDTLGHDAGDRVLCEVAKKLAASLRSFDTLARFAGDEFVILMPDMKTTALEVVAERLRSAVTEIETGAEAGGGAPLRVTVSVGAALGTGDGEDIAALVRLADAAMYDAKRQGGNRVVTVVGTARSAGTSEETQKRAAGAR